MAAPVAFHPADFHHAAFRHVSYPVRIHAGDNALERLGEEADRVRARRALLVCGQTVAHRTNLLDRVKQALGDKLAGVFEGVKAGSPATSVLQGVAKAASLGPDSIDPDLIVAVGGGSAVVTARAITIMLAEGGTLHDHATKYPPGERPISPHLMQPKVPNIVVLTTPTTAAHRAGTAVTDAETGRRLEMFDPKTRPVAVFWDTEALLTASPGLCLSAAGSLFSGVVAGLQSPSLNPLAEGDLTQALNLLLSNLKLVGPEPDNGPVRLNLCAASFMYNRASDSGLTSGATGVVTALAHSLDARYPECDHGAAYSILTAPGMRFNQAHNPSGQARVASLIGMNTADMDVDAAAAAAAGAIADTFGDLGMPLRLRDVGVPREGIELIAQDAMTDFALHRNIRPVKEAAELVELLREAW
ncbi:MAG: iron-containing alcohol dehydrogenase [Chloroflexi bacterium]|nr:iron-containing alcohol dehydrogenase [Chloroflexota bacterium]